MMEKQYSSPSFKPLYDQIKVLLTQSLIGGEWRPGEMIPSEIDLAVRYKVSQGTVRKAIDELAAENILSRRQGKGTFVATHKEENVKLRFLRLTSVDGQKEVLENELLSCTRSKANKHFANILDLKLGAPLIEVKRYFHFLAARSFTIILFCPQLPLKVLMLIA